MLKVRTYTYRDWHQVWPIIRAIVLEQETFVYDPAMIEEDARSMWVDVGKPQPDPYLLAARRLEVPPGECLVIEDLTSGVTAGLAAGMTVWSVNGSVAVGAQRHYPALSDAADDIVNFLTA
jgi:beta-phosphoglucomutase-like phosphatase (HAD superfamily)